MKLRFPEMPEMTPEQMAEMKAYLAAGTPGDAHRALAASAGSYDLVLKSWSDPKAPPMESIGSATRSMVLDGRVMLEEVSISRRGRPGTGHGMSGFPGLAAQFADVECAIPQDLEPWLFEWAFGGRSRVPPR